MSDESTRRARRGATSTAGEVVAHAQEQRARACTIAEELERLVGTRIYVEGARMNYRGVLTGVCWGAMGEPLALVGDWIRTGDWGDRPTPAHDQAFARGMIPWGSVCHVAPTPEAWGDA